MRANLYEFNGFLAKVFRFGGTPFASNNFLAQH
jgi:hypothetical protein